MLRQGIMGCVSAKSVSSTPSTSRRRRAKCCQLTRSKPSAAYTMELTSEEEALFTAISFGKIHRIASLLEKIDDLSIRSADGMTPLIYTCHMTRGELCSHVTRLLLKQKGCDVNAQDKHGQTALMHACMSVEKLDTVRILVRHKNCNCNLADQDGYTALMHAVANDNNEAVDILLFSPRVLSKVDINAHNLEGSSALDIAVKHMNKRCCGMLVNRAGADTTHVHDLARMNFLLKDT